jgi:hypothetical protein
MAQITGVSNEKIFQIKGWLGLHQNPDGDTKLKVGEAADMRNFRITRDGNLQRRPGTLEKLRLSDADPVQGMWTGHVNGKEELLIACSGKIYRCWNAETESFVADVIGEMSTDCEVHFFGFSNIVYMLNGESYMQWDGSAFEAVKGYRPLVNIAVAPDNTSREELESVNRLSAERRLWISPDGEGKVFYLPEKGILSVDYVKNLVSGELLSAEEYSFDAEAGTVQFLEALPKAINSHEIGWTMSQDQRSEVLHMRWSELYSGNTDARIFLYGDGSNRAIYSGVDYDGKPRADYFPDMNEMAIGEANTPITAMIRHYSALLCFKSDSAWTIQASSLTLADGRETEAFYVSPTNRSIGNAAAGQVRLVLNAPYTLFGRDLYEWRNNSSYSSNLSRDERQAKRISDRVYAALGEFNAKDCRCFDDNLGQEFYICFENRALVLNYAADSWYYYENFDAKSMLRFHGELYIGTSNGLVNHFGYEHLNDNGEAIDAYWESGSMSFGQDYMRKYAAQLWIGIEPESRAEVSVTVMTDKKSSYAEKVVASSLSTFDAANFADWSFRTNRKPFMTRLKIKAKKFVFYKLVFQTDSPDTTATILAADIRVRYQGYAK